MTATRSVGDLQRPVRTASGLRQAGHGLRPEQRGHATRGRVAETGGDLSPRFCAGLTCPRFRAWPDHCETGSGIPPPGRAACFFFSKQYGPFQAVGKTPPGLEGRAGFRIIRSSTNDDDTANECRSGIRPNSPAGCRNGPTVSGSGPSSADTTRTTPEAAPQECSKRGIPRSGACGRTAARTGTRSFKGGSGHGPERTQAPKAARTRQRWKPRTAWLRAQHRHALCAAVHGVLESSSGTRKRDRCKQPNRLDTRRKAGNDDVLETRPVRSAQSGTNRPGPNEKAQETHV